MCQRQASPNTVAAYRDGWRLLLGFAAGRTGKQPSELDVADLDAALIGAFLGHLETERHNSVRTRNARLAAIRSFFRFAALRHPEHAALIARVLAIPTKRCDRAEVCYLTEPEADAVMASPDQATWTGRRDHAMLVVAMQTGRRARRPVVPHPPRHPPQQRRDRSTRRQARRHRGQPPTVAARQERHTARPAPL